MKHIYSKLYIFTLFLLALGCSSKHEDAKEFYGFNKFQSLNGKRLELGDNIKQAFDLFIIGELLIVSDPNETYHFTLIDLAEEKKAGEFGKMGDGPCELAFPAYLQLSGNGSKVIGVLNKQKFIYQEFDLSSQNLDTCINVSSKFSFNYQKIIKAQEGVYVGTGLFQNRFAITRAGESGPSLFFGEYPFRDDLAEFDHNILAMAYQGDLLIKPSGGKFVSTSRSSFNFDIVKIGADGSFEIETENRFWVPSFTGNTGSFISAVMTSENKYGCLSTSVSDDFIYILFSGKTKKENGNLSKTVLVYDWEGKPVKVLELDQDLELISVSQDDKTLIGYVDDGQANLYKYNLK